MWASEPREKVIGPCLSVSTRLARLGWEGEARQRLEGGEARLARVAELAEAPAVVGDNEVPFGAIRRGFAADIVATRGDLEKDFEKTEDDIKAIQSVGQIIAEVLKQLDDERCENASAPSAWHY